MSPAASSESVILINPGQVDAFGRFLRETQDQLDAARSHLRRVDDSLLEPPPELRQIIGDVSGAVRLLGTTARGMTSGSDYASRVAQLARRADEGGGLSGLQAKAVKSLVTFAADPTLGGGAAALTKAINTAIGAPLVGRTAEVVVDALAGAYRHGLTGGGARAVVTALGKGLQGAVTPIADLERLRNGSLPPDAGRSTRLFGKIARFALPAGVAIDAFSAVGAVADMREEGLKASNGLALGSAVAGVGGVGVALVASGPLGWGAAAGLGAISLGTGGGSIVAKGKEDDAERRKAWREKLRRNPNTTDLLRRDGPLMTPLTRFPPSSRPRISPIPPLEPLPRLSSTPPRARPLPRPRVDEIPPLEPLPGLSPTPP